MSITQALNPLVAFLDVDGDPLDGGAIYIGLPSANPEISQIQVYWDRAMTQPATQPIKTKGGFPSNAGTPSLLYIARNTYSISVKNKNGTQVSSDPNVSSTDSSAIIFQRPESGAVQRDAKAKLLEAPISPDDFGAVGNGIANDTAPYQLAETAVGAGGVVFIPAGKTYALAGGTILTRAVEGPGQITIGGIPFTGLMFNYSLYRTSLYFTPTNYTEAIGFPTAGDNMLVLVSPSAIRTGSRNRTTIVGSLNCTKVIEIDRCDVYGNQALQFARYTNRVTAVGTNAFQYLGTNNPQGDGHAFWADAGGFVPGQPGWDYAGLETANPGIGAKIAAFSGFATGVNDMGRSVAVGRDTFNATVWSLSSNAVGYRALASSYVASGNNAFGTDAFRNGVLIDNSTALGHLAGQAWQEGTRNTIAGYQVATATVRGSSNSLFGSFAGSDYTDLNSCILIGLGAGNGAGGTTQSNVLAIGNTPTPAIGGNLSTVKFGVNISAANVQATWQVRTSAPPAGVVPHPNGDDLVVENNGNAGITARGTNTGLCSLFFGDPESATVGGVVYSHANNDITFRANDVDQWKVNAASLNPATDNNRSLGTAALRASVIYAGTGTINTSDGRYKSEAESINDLALDAWASVDYQQFKFKDALQEKGDSARLHFGVIAQRVKDAFESVGLDAFDYGLLCYDKWDDQWNEYADEYVTIPAVYASEYGNDEAPVMVTPERRELVKAAYRELVVSAGDRYGVRYEEALCLEAALMRRTQKQMADKIAHLEQLIGAMQ